jgi:ssDNA-binding Zn-finger/Zn-ribbon topoisomerase 1
MPSRNGSVTMAGAVCPTCGRPFLRRGRRRFCSDACRQAAWRHRHAAPPAPAPMLPPRGAPQATVVYECPRCEGRLLGQQRCPDCHVFCRRIGPGGRCPACDEPVAIAELTTPERR